MTGGLLFFDLTPGTACLQPTDVVVKPSLPSVVPPVMQPQSSPVQQPTFCSEHSSPY